MAKNKGPFDSDPSRQSSGGGDPDYNAKIDAKNMATYRSLKTADEQKKFLAEFPREERAALKKLLAED